MVTFASERPFVFVLEPTVHVTQAWSYTKDDLERDLDTIAEHVDISKALRMWDKYKAEFRAYQRPFAKLWYVVTHVERNPDPEVPIAWRAPGDADPRLTRDLLLAIGRPAIEDRDGIMYSSEPEQIVFLDNSSFRVVDTRHKQVLRENPSWSTAAIADSWDLIQQHAPAQWLPQLERVAAKRGAISARVQEYGCGSYGCVYPTLDPTTVVKVTTDPSEAKFALDHPKSPATVEYRMVISLAKKHQGLPIFLLWRESAEQVGKTSAAMEKVIHAQHVQAKRVLVALKEGRSTDRALEKWRQAVVAMTEVVGEVGDGMLELASQGVYLLDVHGGNLGVVTRNGQKVWMVVDPGNVVTRGSMARRR